MFGDLMGDMQAKQEEMKEKLAAIEVVGKDPEGAIIATVNGNKELLNIEINAEKLDLTDAEQLEDFILLAVNNALEKAGLQAEQLSQELVKNMLPGGLGGLGNLFG